MNDVNLLTNRARIFVSNKLLVIVIKDEGGLGCVIPEYMLVSIAHVVSFEVIVIEIIDFPRSCGETAGGL